MKKILLILLILILAAGSYFAWLALGPGTSFPEKSKYLYIRTSAATKKAVLDSLQKNKFIKSPKVFQLMGDQLKYWKSIKPGRYEIKNGTSLYSMIKILRNGQQTPVNLVITKIRLKEDLARMVGNRFECDSSQMITFLNNEDSLKQYGLNSLTVMTAVLPNTYTYFWNTTPRKIFQKLYDKSKEFWTPERKQLATNHGLSTEQVYILASIIEEETNSKSDKPNIASVYLNRIEKKMPLGADPTIKFAMKEFGLKRIYSKYLQVESPYNTYRNTGLPPGPICTPSEETIDAVLYSTKTDYIYFVAKSDLSGSHVFTTNYADHLKYAKEYQKVLNKLDSANKARQSMQK
jgi:UPF0755 protein